MLKPNYRIATASPKSTVSTTPIRICALRVSFPADDNKATTGAGQFLTEVSTPCEDFVVDPAPHNRAYFHDHIRSLANYYNHVSGGKVVIDTVNSTIFPLTDDSSFQVSHAMAFYHPFLVKDSVDLRLTELLVEAVQKADAVVDFSQFDVVIVFHAGVGQDFAITLDPTPYDIPSAYLNRNDLQNYFNTDDPAFQGIPVENGTAYVDRGLILPESQNHLLYDNWEDVFGGASAPCEYQIGLNGTLTFMFGFYLGLPGLYDTESGDTGIGKFGLMDQGSANLNGLIPSVPSAWERVFLGWETPVIAGTMENINLKQIESGADTTIWKIPINAQEYFLVENRCAYVRPGVSLDSIQYRIYEENGENEWPSVFPLIKDTLKAEYSTETGVMLSVPHYDYGLPGSGLLIWHIDESIINPNLAANRVNLDRDHRGVDLEEGDGAQDLGYDAGILASDVNIGWYFDPWFAGNEGFIDLNPDYLMNAEKRVGFTPYTNPATCSNGYAFTGICIDSIGAAGETMTFRIRQSDALENFPIDLATEPEEILPIDLNPGDQSEEILVITDSLRVFNTTGRQLLSAPRNTVNVFDKDSLLIFGIDPGMVLSARRLASGGLISDLDTLGLNGQALIGSQLPISEGLLFTTQNGSGQNYLNYYQPELHVVTVLAVDQAIQKIVGGSDNIFGATDDGQIVRIHVSPLSVETVSDLPDAASGTLVTAFINQNETPDLIHCTDSLLTLILDIGTSAEAMLTREQELNGNLACADIDGDGKVEIIVVSDGQIFAFNEDLTVENNFPIAVPFILGSDQFGAELLTADLDGDSHKEIIVNTSTALLAFNYKGDLLDGFPKIANPQSIKSGILLNTTTGAAYLALTQSDLSILSYNRLASVRLSSNFHTADDWICYGGNAARQFYYNVLSHSSIIPPTSILDQAKTFCWPNPARDNRTNIRYFPNHSCNITIGIYDLAGDLVANFKDSAPLVGEPNEKEWNTSGVESGVYFAVVKAKSGSRSDSKIIRILVVR